MNLHRDVDAKNFVIDLLNAQTFPILRRFAILLGTYTWLSMRTKKEIVSRICKKLCVDSNTCQFGFVMSAGVRVLCWTVIAMDTYPSYADDNTTMQNLRSSKSVEVNINVLQDFQLQKNEIRQQRQHGIENYAMCSDFALLRKCLNAIHEQISREWYNKQNQKPATHQPAAAAPAPTALALLTSRYEHQHATGDVRGDGMPSSSEGDSLQYLGDEITNESMSKIVDNLLMEQPAQENFFVPSDADIFRNCSELPGPSVCSMDDAAVFGIMNRNGWLGNIGDKRRRHYDPLPDWRMPHESWDAWYDTGRSVLQQ